VLELLARRMTWGDAVLVQTAEEYRADAIVTWNRKHFEGKTTVNILTPEEYLATKSLS